MNNLDKWPLGGGILGFIDASAPRRKLTLKDRIKKRAATVAVTSLGICSFCLITAIAVLGVRDIALLAWSFLP